MNLTHPPTHTTHTMNTITREQRDSIAGLVAGMHLPAGPGTREHACSVAAINLALTGELTDSIPDCMSPVIGRWILVIQDLMPGSVRNSDAWKSLLPLAAGTGHLDEPARLNIIMEWLWGSALPVAEPAADAGGYGDAWRCMTSQRTEEAAEAAGWAAEAAGWAAGAAGWAAGWAAEVAGWAAAEAAGWAAEAAGWAAEAAGAAGWARLDPAGLLARLIGEAGAP